MKCPNDQTTLLITERQNIEIDYCPECRGVWLDRGELNKLIERSSDAGVEADRPTPPPAAAPRRHSDDKQDYYTRESHGDGYKKKRKESFLSDLFDF